MSQILEDRLAIIQAMTLKHGSHDSPEDGFCALEAVAYVAGEPHSDEPKCACPVISAFLRSWNDNLQSDEDRTRLLLPLVPQLVGTRSTTEVQNVRALLCIDWIVREWLPEWLELTPALAVNAAALRALKPIQDWPDLDAALATIVGAKDSAAAARAAARTADVVRAWNAVRASDVVWGVAAAWDAARAETWAAARAETWAASRNAAWAAARAETWAASRNAAWAAARDAAAISSTKERLQLSAVKLIKRMIAVK